MCSNCRATHRLSIVDSRGIQNLQIFDIVLTLRRLHLCWEILYANWRRSKLLNLEKGWFDIKHDDLRSFLWIQGFQFLPITNSTKYVHFTSCSCQPDSRSDGQTDHESGRATGRFAKEIPIVGRRNLDPRKMTMRSWRKIREGTVVSGKKLR